MKERPDWLNEPDPDKARGIHYADGGIDWGKVVHPDPARIAEIHAEWENL